jgi:hypothetical protein
LYVTDAAINIQPDLETKIDILQNAIDMMVALEVENPKVAILSAVESVNPAIPSTLDAAALCKMADRGQITGAIVDGPLAFDNAISSDAARIKKIVSRVAGDPDLLMVPNLEAGNILFKQLQYLAGALAAGVVVGAKVPMGNWRGWRVAPWACCWPSRLQRCGRRKSTFVRVSGRCSPGLRALKFRLLFRDLDPRCGCSAPVPLKVMLSVVAVGGF